ncbi:MAG: cyclic nucleotide-binding domain-containing protein [Pseudomonadota bacterium]
MAVAPKNVDINLVRKLIPLDTLALKKVEEVLNKSALQKVPAGRILFKEGDRDKWTVYLLSGEVELSSANGSSERIKAGTDIALKPLAKGIPRSKTATSKSDVSVLIIDTELLNVLLNWNSPSSIEVSDFADQGEDEEDWMTRFLQSGAFIQLPAANMQSLLMKLKEVPLTKGKIVIKEGDCEDQNYYIIKQGQCMVSRLDHKSGKQKPLAILRSGVGFGEEALITGAERGATVSMKTDGVVLKLDKTDFIELLVRPLIHFISKEQLAAEKENIIYIDVRSKIEYQKNALENSIHCPVRSIREKIPQLNPEAHYIVYSNAENRASSIAFLFIQQDLDVSVLKGGVGRPYLTAEEIEVSKFEEELTPRQPPQTQSTSSQKNSSQQPTKTNKTPKTANSTPVQQNENNLLEQLHLAQQNCKKAEDSLSKLQIEFARLQKRAIKDNKIAKNAVLILRKSEQKIKTLEAQLKNTLG